MSLSAIVPSSRRQHRRWCSSGEWCGPWTLRAEARASISEREQVAPREWDEGDLSYADDYWCDAGWCDAGDCVICNGGDVRTPPLRRPLLARAA